MREECMTIKDKYRNELLYKMPKELDHHCAKALIMSIDNLIEKRKVKTLVLDFSETCFMDSSGIGAIVGRYKNVKRKGGTLCIINLRKGVQKVFEIAGLYKVIETYEDLEEALRAI